MRTSSSASLDGAPSGSYSHSRPASWTQTYDSSPATLPSALALNEVLSAVLKLAEDESESVEFIWCEVSERWCESATGTVDGFLSIGDGASTVLLVSQWGPRR